MHVQGGKNIRLSQPQQMMAATREAITEAYAGDIIGVFDPGIFSIGDTICDKKMNIEFEGIPTCAPERFAIVEQVDSMKRKQVAAGMQQIAQEGAIQIFFEPNGGLERVIVGVVGELQFEVLESRMESEYKVKFRRTATEYQFIRRYLNKDVLPTSLNLYDTKWVKDVRGRDYLIFRSEWCIKWAYEKNEGIELAEFGTAQDDDD